MGSIFISYRREDSAATVGRVYDRLVSAFGRAAVFKDVDSIPLGVDFHAYIDGVLRHCSAVLVIIGPQWLSIADSAGHHRLDNPQDVVRQEVESALRLGLPVVPVLVQGASMPPRDALPQSLQTLASRNGMPIRYDPDFEHDMWRLVAALQRWMAPPQWTPAPPPMTPPTQPISTVPLTWAAVAPSAPRVPLHRRPSVRWGLLFGVILAIWLGMWLLFVDRSSSTTLFGTDSLLVLLGVSLGGTAIVIVLTGFVAAQRTGVLGVGVLAALVAFLVGGIPYYIAFVFWDFSDPNNPAGSALGAFLFLFGLLIVLLPSATLLALLGAALGRLLHRRHKAQSAKESKKQPAEEPLAGAKVAIDAEPAGDI